MGNVGWFDQWLRGTVNLSRTSRDFEAERVAAAEARREARRANDDDSSIRWGGPSNFGQDDDGYSVSIRQPGTEENPETSRPVKRYTETSRSTQKVKIYNPDDEEQWVEVERILSITFSGSDGFDHLFTLNWSDE